MLAKNGSDLTNPSTTDRGDRALTPQEHAARAMLLAGNHGGNLWYDSHTNAYRPRSPAGGAYKYSGCLDADTLEPLPKGEALRRELENRVRNTVSNVRLGIDGKAD